VGDWEIGGAGAAALAAQVPTVGLIAAGNPSDASVDDEGVLGRLIKALLGSGLSMSCCSVGDRAAGNRAGRPF
jgi:hypothetical protein